MDGLERAGYMSYFLHRAGIELWSVGLLVWSSRWPRHGRQRELALLLPEVLAITVRLGDGVPEPNRTIANPQLPGSGQTNTLY